MHWSCPCTQISANLCTSQQAHDSAQVTTTTTHTTQRTTPINFCASLTNPSRGSMYRARPRAPCRGLARCSGHNRNNGPAAAGRQRQPGHHVLEGLTVGKPCLGPAQVLVHDSRRLAGSYTGIFHLALLISDLFPSPSLLGMHGFHIGDKGGVGPGLRQHRGGDGNGDGNGNGIGVGGGRGSGPKNVKFSNSTYMKSNIPESINR
jgi:hypothetical protein